MTWRDARSSRQNVLHHLTMHVSQPLVPASVAVGQLRVIYAKLVQDCGVDIVNRQRVDDRRVAELIRLTVSDPCLETAAGEDHREAVDVVIATTVGDDCRSVRSSSHFSRPQNNSL